jgi:hypothetical protein
VGDRVQQAGGSFADVVDDLVAHDAAGQRVGSDPIASVCCPLSIWYSPGASKAPFRRG